MADEDVKIPTQDELVAIMEQEEAAAAAPAEATPAAPSAPAVPESAPQVVQPAPAAAQESKPLSLTDTDLVVDPADGQPKPWGSIKGERLRQADYTRKTMELADMRRGLEEQVSKLKLEAEAAKLRAEMGLLPALPEDDPYAQRILAQQKMVEQQAQALQNLQAQMEQREMERQTAIAQAQLREQETRLKSELGLDDQGVDLVEHIFTAKRSFGMNAEIPEVAKEFKAYVDRIVAAEHKKWADKNRVGSPAGGAAPPASGVAPPPIDVRSEGFIEMIKRELSGAAR